MRLFAVLPLFLPLPTRKDLKPYRPRFNPTCVNCSLGDIDEFIFLFGLNLPISKMGILMHTHLTRLWEGVIKKITYAKCQEVKHNCPFVSSLSLLPSDERLLAPGSPLLRIPQESGFLCICCALDLPWGECLCDVVYHLYSSSPTKL